MNQSAAGDRGMGIIKGNKVGEYETVMLNSHCNNNDKNILKSYTIAEIRTQDLWIQRPP